jgi:hypothetical protein
VSERALDALRELGIDHATVEEFAPPSRTS